MKFLKEKYTWGSRAILEHVIIRFPVAKLVFFWLVSDYYYFFFFGSAGGLSFDFASSVVLVCQRGGECQGVENAKGFELSLKMTLY